MSVESSADKRRRDPRTGEVWVLVGDQWMTEKDAEAARQSDRSAVNRDIVTRRLTVNNESWRESDRSVEAVICSDAAVGSHEVRSGRTVQEIWLMSGLEYDSHVPLLNDHKRDNVREVLGSVSEFRTQEHDAIARLYISEAEAEIAKKVREGHIKEVSVGGERLEMETVPPRQTRVIGGRSYTANDQPLNIVTRLRVMEVSLTAKGADSNAIIRSQTTITRSSSMNEYLKRYLVRQGMSPDATDEECRAFEEGLNADVQKACRSFAEADEKEAADRKRAEEEAAEDAKRRAKAAEQDVIRKASEDGAKAERERRAAIERYADVVPKEVIRKAIDDNWTAEQAAREFLEAIRTGRAAAAAPGGSYNVHSRSVERDLNADVLGAAMVIRSLNQIPSGKAGSTFASNPVNLLNRYVPGELTHAGMGDWIPDYPTRELGEVARKRNEDLFNQADRFRNMSLVDVCRHCCRLDGIAVDGYTSPSAIVGAALGSVTRAGAGASTGAFGAIFTTNFNAMFLAGYLEAADTTMGWVTEDDAPNFLPGEIATATKMGHLTLDGKGQADHMTYGDYNERIKVDRFSGMFEVDEKDLINDRFGALGSMSPQEMGLSARRVRPNLIYSILLGSYVAGTGRGPTLNQTTKQLFCSDHGNFLTAANNDLYTADTGAVGTAGLQKALPAIKAQRLNGIPLNLTPRFVLMSPYLDMGMRIALFSTQRIVASGTGGTLNPLQAFNLEPRADARLDDVGSVNPLSANAAVVGLKYHYFLICRPGEEGAKTMVCRYLSGTGRAPQIRSYVLGGPGAPGRWGIGWDVKLDIGAAVADYRGMYYAESTT